jgi:ATP-binding cassette subfamily B protein
VGGRDVRDMSLETLRALVGLVPQDIFLFSETIRENIGFGVSELPDPMMQLVAHTAAIHDEVMEFPERFESMIGERGSISPGAEAARGDCARAGAPAPHPDSRRRALQRGCHHRGKDSQFAARRARERTAILISHRVSTARQADRIVVLDDGAIASRERTKS